MHSSNHKTSFRLGLRSFGLLALTLPLAAQQQLSVSSDLSSDILTNQSSAASGPELEWSRFEIRLNETGYGNIIANYQTSDPTSVAQQKSLAKDLWTETFFAAGGNVGALRDGGTLAGFEFTIFEASNPVGGPSSWEDAAEIVGPDASGNTVHLGTLYLYGQADWDARLSFLAAQAGGTPLSQYDVWDGPTFHASGTGNALRMGGDGNTLIGDAYSADQFQLGGSNWTALSLALYVGSYTQFGNGHQLGASQSSTTQATPAPLQSSSAYIALAASAGQSFTGDLVILNDGNGGAMTSAGAPLSGVVYASGDVLVDGSYISESLTIIAGGSIDESGSNNVLSYAVDGLLFWSLSTDTADAVAIDGQSNLLTGAVHGPSVEVRVGGSNNTMTGRLAGARVKITGNTNLFSDGTN